MPVITQLVSNLAGAIGCDFRRNFNDLIFVEFGGKLSSLKLGPATIISSGTTTLKGTYTFNFDTGTEGANFATSDVWWEQQTDVLRQMVPVHAAQIVNLGTLDFDALSPVQLKGFSYSTRLFLGITTAAINWSMAMSLQCKPAEETMQRCKS
jgi:hypothetical protein